MTRTCWSPASSGAWRKWASSSSSYSSTPSLIRRPPSPLIGSRAKGTSSSRNVIIALQLWNLHNNTQPGLRSVSKKRIPGWEAQWSRWLMLCWWANSNPKWLLEQRLYLWTMQFASSAAAAASSGLLARFCFVFAIVAKYYNASTTYSKNVLVGRWTQLPEKQIVEETRCPCNKQFWTHYDHDMYSVSMWGASYTAGMSKSWQEHFIIFITASMVDTFSRTICHRCQPRWTGVVDLYIFKN